MTPDRMLRWLLSFPYPGAVVAMQGGELTITLEGEVLRFDGAWRAPDGQRIPCTLDDAPSADDLHAEIRRGLAVARGITGASWREIKADCVGSDLSADDPYIPTLAEIADEPPLKEWLHDRLVEEINRRRDVEQALAQKDAELQTLKGMDDTRRARINEIEAAMVKVRAQRDEAIARADKIEDRLRRDDELREQIAVAVGLDGSASLALILNTVTRDRPAREISRLSGLLDVFAAPITFGERRLSTVERAEWALRRTLRERDECAPRMAQLIEAEVFLDVLGVPAYAAVPGDDPGDASEALTVAERLRLYSGAQP